jgi:arginase
MSKKVFIIGAGYPGGQPKKKIECGPDAIRSAGLHVALQELEWTIKDHGDIDFTDVIEKTETEAEAWPRAKNAQRVSQCTERLFQELHTGLISEPKVIGLTLGGDHSLAIGSIAASSKVNPGLGVIWVDAHADINTPDVSPSGNVHGMPVAFLLNVVKDRASLVGEHFSWLSTSPSPLSPERLVYIGLRDVDDGEKTLLKDLNILAFSMHEVDQLGIGEVMKRTLKQLEGRPLHLSYDVDANDPSVSPSTGTRVPGGLSRREARYLCEEVFARLVKALLPSLLPALPLPLLTPLSLSSLSSLLITSLLFSLFILYLFQNYPSSFSQVVAW